jgi:hypothetical protein
MEMLRKYPMGVTIGQENFDDNRQIPERLLGFPLNHVIEHDDAVPWTRENLCEPNW